MLTIHILESWGDMRSIGLCGLEVLDRNFRSIPLHPANVSCILRRHDQADDGMTAAILCWLLCRGAVRCVGDICLLFVRLTVAV